ncbi:MAG: hypothetical protein H6R17_1059 [Proteobacteria bacterium]|nr:hypothetical protein [Pseudomonadota bacterium]
MSSISSISSSILASLYSSKSAKTGSSSSAVEQLFAQLDTTGKGYLEKSDLSTAFSQISATTSSTSTSATSTASVDDVFAKLDSNSDGKVTEDELSTGLDALAQELDSQFNQMRMSGGMPPPPPSSDSGFTKDELTQQLSDISSSSSSSDSARSDLLTKVVANFDAADTNSDGKVTFAEATAYDQSTTSSSSSTSSTASTDAGFTVDELTQQLRDIGTSDSTRSELISNVVANFAAADSNSDGKVSNAEAMDYDKSSQATATSATDSTTSSDLAIMKRIMELMNAYALTNSTDSNSVASTLSISA